MSTETINERFDMVAKTFQGLEEVLADELRALGAEDVTPGRRMVAFSGDKQMLYRANFACRTALRILKPFYKFQSTDADDLYEKVKQYDWSQIMSPDKTFAIDVTAFGEEFKHSRFVTYRVKDAIADFFMEREGRRPSIRLTNPHLQLDVHISGRDVILSLDSSGEPLYKRGWRVAQTDAPINEVLAAGIIKLSGWDGQCDLIDPMCGSGTFLVEAALIAANIAPGVYRKEYAFQQWPDYDEELFSEIYNDDSQEREFTHKIYGYDIAHQAIDIAGRNVKNASVAKMVELQQRDLRDWTEAPAGGMLITNPPYGQRLKYDNIEALYEALGDKLKHVFVGYDAWVIGYDRDLTDLIGLKASVRYPLFNGALECELRQYKIFEGKYNEMRGRGEDIKNDDFRASSSARRPRRDDDRQRPPFNREDRQRRDDDRQRPPFNREDRPRRDDDRQRPPFNREDRPRRDDDRPRPPFNREDRPRRDDDRPRHEEDRHSERYANRVLRSREPSLGADKEVPIIHGRRKSWKRKDLE